MKLGGQSVSASCATKWSPFSSLSSAALSLAPVTFCAACQVPGSSAPTAGRPSSSPCAADLTATGLTVAPYRHRKRDSRCLAQACREFIRTEGRCCTAPVRHAQGNNRAAELPALRWGPAPATSRAFCSPAEREAGSWGCCWEHVGAHGVLEPPTIVHNLTTYIHSQSLCRNRSWPVFLANLHRPPGCLCDRTGGAANGRNEAADSMACTWAESSIRLKGASLKHVSWRARLTFVE